MSVPAPEHDVALDVEANATPAPPWVVDASVAVKWFLPEVHAGAALRLLQPGHTLLAPDLLFPEVGNIVWKRVRAGEMNQEEGAALLQALGAIPLQIHPSWPLVQSALEIACNAGRTVYDSLYLALAVREGGLLVTADAKLFNALREGPLGAFMRWVGDV